MSAATAEADQLLAESRDEAERVSAELAARERQQSAELDRLRTDTLAQLADEKAALEARVDRLRRQESEHRDRLRDHFTEQLAQLDDDAPAVLRAVAD